MTTASRRGPEPSPALQRRLRRQLASVGLVLAAVLAGGIGIAVMPILDRIVVFVLLLVVSYVLAISLADFFRRE